MPIYLDQRFLELIILAENECSFSVELASRQELYGLIVNGARGKGLTLHGSLGEILKIEFLDDSVMVITGEKGVIRLDLLPETLSNMLKNELD
jgi:hypothetical protein